jgi:hypothetical protein
MADKLRSGIEYVLAVIHPCGFNSFAVVSTDKTESEAKDSCNEDIRTVLLADYGELDKLPMG